MRPAHVFFLAAVLAGGPLACAAPADDADAAETSESGLSSTAPVRITSDHELARNASAGSGTASDPYVIASRRITGHFSFSTGADLDACFEVSNTTKHFVIEKSTCQLAHVGIKLANVQNATIRNVSLTRIVGVFGWASAQGGGEEGRGISIERSSHVTIDGAKISDVYGGFGTFGVPGGPSAQDGRAGGAAVGIRVVESNDVALSGSRVENMWGGAGGAGAASLFAGDPNGVGGRGGLGGMAVGVAFEDSDDVVVSKSEVDGIRAGAGAAAAVSNVFFVGGNGGDAGSGSPALGIVAVHTRRLAIRESRVSELWGSAGGAGAVGGVGAVGGQGGHGGAGGSAIAIAVGRSSDVTLSGNDMSTMRGGAGGAGAAGVVGFIGGAGGHGGDGGWGAGVVVLDTRSVSVTNNQARTVTGGAGAAGGAGAIGAWMIEAQGGNGGDGGWSVGSAFVTCERVETARNATEGQIAGTGGLGGGIQLFTMGAAGAAGERHDSITQR
jgi:hypothetical protein